MPISATALIRDADRSTLLRWTFVGMLFALALEGVAIRVAGLLTTSDPPLWHQQLAAGTHLVLALVVIALSWVGWSRSVAPGNHDPLHRPLSWAFVVLLLDLALVIVYFALVRASDVEEDGSIRMSGISAVPESKFMLVVFALYLIWDGVADVIMANPSPAWRRRSRRHRWLKWRCSLLRLNGAVSAACIFPTAVTFLVACQIQTTLGCHAGSWQHAVAVALCTCGLIAVAVWFRALKPLELVWKELWPEISANGTRERPTVTRYRKFGLDRRWADWSAWAWGSFTLAALALSVSTPIDQLLMVVVVVTLLCMMAISTRPCRQHLRRFLQHESSMTLTCHQPPAAVADALSKVFDDPDLHHDAAPEFCSAGVRWSESCESLKIQCTAAPSDERRSPQAIRIASHPAVATMQWLIRIDPVGDETQVCITETGELHCGRARRIDRFKHGHACRIELVLKCLSSRLRERSPRLE